MAVKTCPKCKGKVSETRDVCPHCDYNFNKKMIVCPDCDSEVEEGISECPVCGYYFDAIDDSSDDVDLVESAPIPMAKVSIKESNPNSSNVHLAKFRRKITKEQFLRSVLIELSLDPNSPADILSAEFGEVEEAEIQGYLIQGVVNGSYSGMIGIDRVEEYVTQEQKYVPSNTHYTSGGIDFYEKEGARHLVDVTKTKTVTDWQIHNGEIINEHHSAVKTELGYEDFESSFWKLFRRDDLDKIHDESIDNEKLPNGFYDKGIDLLRNDVVNGVSWPGDHHKDESFNISIDDYKIYRCIVPTYQVSCVYKGQVCLVQGFAIDQIAPVIEKQVSTSSNSVEGLKREEGVEINQKKKITLSAKIVAILAAISGFIGFIMLVYGGKPLPLFIGFLAGIAVSVCLGVVAYVNIASIKKKYEKKTEQLSYMKYILLKQELDKRGFPELTDEEKDSLQYSMGIDSLDDIDETLIFEPTNVEETEIAPSKNTKTKTIKSEKNKKKLTKKQKIIIGSVSGVVGAIAIAILVLIMVIPKNPLHFDLCSDGTYGVSCSESNITEVQIPESYKGKPVTSILSFNRCTQLESITIPEGITSIGTSAFSDCGELSSVTLPSTLRSIGGGAFENCCNLKNIVIPKGVTNIELGAFEGCIGLETITIPCEAYDSNLFGYIFSSVGSADNNKNVPDSLKEVIIIGGTKIEDHAFDGCENLTNITIPNSVTSIGAGAFYNCTSLTSITIPDSVISIGNYALSGCTGLTSVTIPNSVTNIGSSVFSGCTALESMSIPFAGERKDGTGETHFGYIFGAYKYFDQSEYVPESLKTVIITDSTGIGEYTFCGCSGLTSVSIPNSVTSIGDYAFCDCTGLTSMVIPDIVTSIGERAFENCVSLRNVIIGNGIENIGVFAFLGCTGLTSITIPDNVTSICSGAFYECAGLTSVIFENSQIKRIDDHAFARCYNLAKITIPDSVIDIGKYAFEDCSKLTSIVIPDSVIDIHTGAFYGCSSLVDVTIGSGVASIGGDVFYKCDSLANVYISDLSKWCGISFDDSYSSPICYANNLYLNGNLITDLVIPDGVTSFDNLAFSGYSKLVSVTIPDSVTSIVASAFRYCENLKSVTIGNGVQSIDYGAFYGCTSLTSVTIGNGVTSIGEGAFSGCISLVSIVIPDSVTHIGWHTFENCTNLTIYCEAESQPSDWNFDWDSECEVIWGYKETN